MRRGHSRRLPVLAGLLIAVLVGLAGSALWFIRPSQYEASTALVVLPSGQNDESASFYDTLSRGQVVETFAEILGLQGGQQPELRAAGVTVVVEVVPDTSLIEVRATAADAVTAERFADSVLVESRPYFSQLSSPYSVSVVRDATDTAQQVGLPLGPLVAVVAVVAVLTGVAAALATRALLAAGDPLRVWRRYRGDAADTAVPARDVPAAAPARDSVDPPRKRPAGSDPVPVQSGA